MPNQFLSPEGDIENYFVTEYWLIDQYIGDSLWTWGVGTSGELGNTTIISSSTPVTTFSGGTNWKQISCGNNGFAAAIKTDGTLWTWGNGGNGRLGNATITNSSTPVTTFSGGTNWKQVSCGSFHMAAIKTDGTLWTWGLGTSGQLGNASIISSSTPVTIFSGGTNWKQVSCGGGHSAAIKTDGTLWVWGQGTSGILGNASITNSSTPVTTFAGGTNWKQVSAGSGNISAIKTDGTLWSWGSGGNGRLGNASLTNTSTPVTTFAGGTNWKQVGCGDGHIASIKTDGTLWTWGNGGNGRLGNASIIGSSTPVTTFSGGTNWKQVSCGGGHMIAIKTDGTLWTWGDNFGSADGNLGNATTNNSSTPVTTFAGGTNWKQVSAGTNTAAVTTGISPDLPLS